MEVVGVAGLIAAGAFLGGLAVYVVMRRHMNHERNEAANKIEQLKATVKQLTRMVNGRRTVERTVAQILR